MHNFLLILMKVLLMITYQRKVSMMLAPKVVFLLKRRPKV